MKMHLGLLVLSLILITPFATAHAQSPALSPIGDVTVNAGDTVTLNVVATDGGNGEVTLSSSLPLFAEMNSPRIGIGQVVTTLTITPGDIDVGDYTAAVSAVSGGVSDTQTFNITVNPAGSPAAPVVSSPGLREVGFDTSLSFTVDAVDPDGGGIASLVASPLPSGATFTPDAGNGSGTFSWMPSTTDAGQYDIEFTATGASGLSNSSTTHIRVTGPPELAIDPIDDVIVEDGGFASVPVRASGLPGATIEVTASLPSFAMLNPPGAGIGSVSTTMTVLPPIGSAGTYRASVTATSDGDIVTELFDIIVAGDGGPENNPPVVIAPMTATGAAGQNLNLLVTASDPDGDPVDLFGSALPPGASFLDNGDNTGLFSWTPMPGQEGDYVASFSGLDNRGGSGAASTQISVAGDPGGNLPPAVIAPAAEEIDEGVTLSFVVTATDPDGDPIALTADKMPMGAIFTDQDDDSGIFTWTPGPEQSGTYEVAFNGNDGRGGTGTASTVITVNEMTGVGECPITGDLDLCEGESGELCGPDGARSYSWVGPYGFTADTQCIQVDVRGIYELTVVNEDQSTSYCTAVVEIQPCDLEVVNCPRGLGFWKQQCDQKGNGSTKFTLLEMDQIASCVDESSEYFTWTSDFDEFCEVIDPEKPMDVRKQAIRMYAVMLANVCAGRLGIVAGNGEMVALDPSTPIYGSGIDGVGTIGDLMSAAELRLSELEKLPLTSEAKEAYGQLKDSIERVNEGHGIGPLCTRDDSDDGEEDDEEGKYGGDSQEALLSDLNPVVSPNPLNPNTELSFSLARDGRVRVNIYNVQGQLVRQLMDEYRGTGVQRVQWDGTDNRSRTVPSGVYFIRIQTPQGEVTKRATVLK
jgi:hypothetical protein